LEVSTTNQIPLDFLNEQSETTMNGLVLSSGKQDLIINPPIMNSAGVLGFIPDDNEPFDLNLLGAFITHPISLRQRQPAKPSHFEKFPGGVLLHTGLPNPGIRKALHSYRGKWQLHAQPIILHLLVEGVEDMEAIVEVLDSEDHPVQALEIGIVHTTPAAVEAVLTTASLSQLPILARVHPDSDYDVLLAAQQSGINAVVIGPPRGNIKTRWETKISGRLYGPGLHPLIFAQLERFLEVLDIPIILGSGLFSTDNILCALDEGAAAVQLDTVLWLDPTAVLEDLLNRSNHPLKDH
jgi:dihydroorotate dehydrogenase